MSEFTIEKKDAKYRIPVYTKAYASKLAGHIECDSLEEYNKKIEDNYDVLLNEGYFSVNISNDFELNDVEVEESDLKETDLQYFEVK